MRTFLGIILCFCVVNLPLAQGDCVWTYGQADIDDTAVNREIFNYTASESFEFVSWEIKLVEGGVDDATALSYFNHDQQENTLFISTSDNFKNLNSDAYTDGKTTLLITLVIKLTCNGKNTESTLLVLITNTNQNAPAFSKESFTYSLPMPIMPKTDFSLYGDEIIATDIDFSNTQISFSIDPNHFAVTASKIENKTFKAVFSATQMLRFNESQTYTLTATDLGSPAKSTPVTITFNVDPTSGFDSPSFSSAYYSYNYTSGDTPALIPTGGEIVIQSDKSDEATYKLSGDYTNSFDVIFENTSNTFSISLKSDTSLPEDNSDQIILTLSFTTDVTVSAVILITIVKDESIPIFTSDYYVGTYDETTNVISWNEPIKITDASAVTISGEKASLFTINSTTYELTPKSSLSASDFDDNLNLFLTIIASSTSKAEARAPIVISLAIPEELKFDSVSYYGSYKIEDKKGVVTLDGDIGFNNVTDFTGITITVDISYIEIFKIDLDSATWKVTVLQELSSTIINKNSELAIPITASKTGESTKAILILTLPDNAEINFDQSYYTATYVQGDVLDTVALNQDIIIEGVDGGDIVITPEGYTDNFLIGYNSESSKYEITVKNNLNSSILNEETQLIITITALKVDESITSSSVLVLKLPEKLPFQFGKNHYAATYIEGAGSQATVEITGSSIKMTGADVNNIEFKFEGYEDNFQMEYDANSTSYNVIVRKTLNSSTYASKQLIIPITASAGDTSATASTVLLLTLPEATLFNFEKNYYEADYIEDTSSSATVKLADTIKVTGADSTKIEFTFEDYNENFKMEYDSASTSYKIIVQKILDLSAVNLKQLVITITATQTDISAPTNTVLVLTLPETSGSIYFEKNYYEADYIEDTSSSASVKLADTIKVTGANSTKIEFTFGDYTENFKMEYDSASTSYKIIVQKILDLSAVNLKQLVITITATQTDISAPTNTVLVLTLPETSGSIYFEKNYYEADYIEDTSSSASVKLADTIKVTGANSTKIEFTFGDYTENFKMEYDSASTSYKIIVQKILDLSAVNLKQLVITITATQTDISAPTNTVLVLTLPETSGSINFEKNYYEADYIEDTSSSASVKLADTIKVTGADSTKIEFTFGEYNENFKMEYDSASTSYKVIVQKILDLSAVNLKQLVITITATQTDISAPTNTVLVLMLPKTPGSINFEKNYYEADYIEDTSSSASVKLADTIKVTGANSSKIEFTFGDYNENFKMEYDSASTSYKVIVQKILDLSAVNLKQLVITITATQTDISAPTNTVLVLTLPETSGSIYFEKNYYEADYIEDTSSSASVKLADTIKVTGANSTKIEFTFGDYTENFKMEYDSASTSYKIIVQKILDLSAVNLKQLVITITATQTDISAPTNTVLVLTLPETSGSIYFEKNYYEADYIEDTSSSASVKLADTIKVTGANSTKIEFTFGDYTENFKMEYDSASTSYKIIVQKILDLSAVNLKQLVITITATQTDISAPTNTVLVLTLPETTGSINFEKNYYEADYIEDTSSSASVKLANTIKVTGANSTKIEFTFGDYTENFKMEYDSASTSYKIIVQKILDLSAVNLKQLVITITATQTDISAPTNTVLMLTLPETSGSINFEKNYYEADYIEDTSSSASVKLADTIKVTGADSTKIEFTFGDYNENFKMEYDSASTSYKVIVQKILDLSAVNLKQLVITITATQTDISAPTNTVLVLMLPKTPGSINFEKNYYEADYIEDTSSSASVKLADTIKVTGANSSKIEFTFGDYNENFKMEYDSASTSYKVIVQKILDLSAVNLKQLVITITATQTDISAPTNTVLVLTLPETPGSINFENNYYAADYIEDTLFSASVKLVDTIKVTGADSTKIEFTFEGYENNFALQFDTSAYEIIVKQPLNDSILSANSHLVITIAASVTDSPSLSASTLLILRLPSDKISTTVFEDNYYVATYTVSTSLETDHIEATGIKITSPDFAKAALYFEGYDDNFAGTCDAITLQCIITVKSNLNASILSSNTELVLSLSANNEDKTSTGITVLLVKLPLYSSTFKFTSQHYSAVYTIEKEDNGQATVTLNEDILFDGADSKKLSLVADDYSDQFSFNFDTKWNIIVQKNLDKEILGNNTELIISLTATRTEEKDSSKATLVIKLPDNTMIAFGKPQYSGDYIISGDQASVILGDNSEIETTDTSVQIKLDSYENYFEAKLDDNSKWTINVKEPLDSSIFTENTQLNLVMSINKVGVTYGKASLIIKLPTPRFNKGFYIGEYSDVGDASISAEDIEVYNVEAANIQVNLSTYNEYIYTDLVNSTWVVKLNKPLPSDIIQTKDLLITTLQAIRQSDNLPLATSTLVVKLPNLNLTGVPEFNQFAFYGEYKNSSDKATVELNESIGFSNLDTVTVLSVAIEEGTSKYSSYFTLNHRTDGDYDISVNQNLPEDLLSTESNVVLSLIASTNEGINGHAALVINLPKITREVSVQFQDEQILYNATYENGTFKSPSIILETNSTDDKISVVITNDLNLDNTYFTPTCKSKVISLNVAPLPEEILEKYTVIPLKLAITDKDTGDTVYAVVNVNVNYNSGGGGGNGDDDDDSSDERTGLLVAVIILAILLIAVIVATILLWYFKIRNTSYVKMEEDAVEKSTAKSHPFTKNLSRQASTSVPSNSSSLRRPTGLPIGFVPSESPTEEISNEFETPPVPTAPVPENEKKVVFDDHVQNIDDFENDPVKPSNKMQNVGDRRPTQFVFAYPMEAVLDIPTDSDERRESSDYDDHDTEKKKSVLFDENVERMHIDVDDEDNEDNEENDVGDNEDEEEIKKDNLNKFKTELEVKLDELLPTEVIKENSLDL